MVNRQTLTANQETEFNFGNNGSEFVVKNFTSGYIYVCADEYEESKAYKIPSMTAQKIKARTSKMIVKALSGGEVEIDA